MYIVRGTDVNGCYGYDTVNIMLAPGLIITATPADISACEGSTVQLNATGAISYKWTPGLGLSNANIPDPLLKIIGNGIYIVKGTDSNGCYGYDTVNIILTSGISITASPKDTIGCIGDTIQLNVTGAADYSWYPPTGLSNEKIANPVLTIIGNGKYIVKGIDENGCTGYDSIEINHYPIPLVDAYSEENQVTCSRSSVQLYAKGAQNYLWSPGIYCDDKTSASPKVSPPINTVFTVKGTDEHGCFAEDTITVSYSTATIVKVPNAFTPNNDGQNNTIRPIIICDFKLETFRIYNRWGKEVFISEDLLRGWDGTVHGVPQDAGVFYYLLKGKNSKDEGIIIKGDITLIR